MANPSAMADEEGRKVFLGGLTYDASENDLRTDFGKYGEMEDVQMPMGEGGKHKGFAFLTFRSADDAAYACKPHHQRNYMGREISAKIVVPRSERSGGGGAVGGDRPGDWLCPRCSANVFASKSACFKCGEPKPSRDSYDDRHRRDDHDRRRDDYDRRDDRRDDRHRRDDYDRRRDDYDRRDDYGRRDDRRRDDYDRRRDDDYGRDDRRRDRD